MVVIDDQLPDWYNVRTKSGTVGLVPKTYFEQCESDEEDDAPIPQAPQAPKAPKAPTMSTFSPPTPAATQKPSLQPPTPPAATVKPSMSPPAPASKPALVQVTLINDLFLII